MLEPDESPSLNDDGPTLAAFFDEAADVTHPSVQTPAILPGSREDWASEIIESILRAAHRLRGLLASHFGSFGLSDVRYSVLRIVREHAPLGCTQAEVAHRLDQSESSVSALIERMRESSLIYRLRSKTDRRKRVLILTDLGRRLLAETELQHGKRSAELLSQLELPQLEQLALSLRSLCEELARAENSPAANSNAPIPSQPYLRAAELVEPAELHRHRPVA
ncbi:MAG: MarR family winged helix-turn-helix transcriptional regulator [Planctomycetaceae bacterium]